MADETDQAEADQSDDQESVIDPLDAMNSTNSGDDVTPLTAYEEEIEALKNGTIDADASTDEDEDEPEQSADEFEDQEQDDDQSDDEEQEEEEPEQEEEEEEPEAKVSDRFRFKDDEDKAIAALSKARGISLREASRLYDSMNPEQSDSTPDEQTPTARAASDIEAEILRLEDEEIESIRLVDVDRQAEIKLELRKLAKDLVSSKESETQSQASLTQKLNADYEASCAKATKAYPGLTDPNSAIFKRVQQLEALAEKNGDPIFDSPDKLWILGKQAAVDTGTLMAKTAPAPKKSEKNVTTFKPSSNSARSTSADAPNRADQEIEALDDLAAYERMVGLV